MSATLIATYANGVFTPKSPVDLPENATVELVVKEPPASTTAKPEPGSPEAWAAYIQHLKESNYRFGGGRFDRESLYDDRI